MAMLNPYQQYAQNQVTTATPEELTHLLYKGAVKFITSAIKAINEQKLEEAHNNIIKTQNIYQELLATLDYKYPVSKNLANLYEYIIDILVRANIKKDIQLLEQALGFSKDFVEIWGQAVLSYRRSQGGRPAGLQG